MKKFLFTIITMLSFTLSAKSMGYEQARNEALFLTDKMAYELNLTADQYEAAYEINLDYLMGVTGRNDVFGTYWERRNLDMSYILFDWQWSAFQAASYFFRPLYWEAGCWHFGIYARYPRRHYLYFGRPAFYASYRGGHSWRMNGGRSYYHGRREHFIHTGSRNHGGMRDGWNRGDFKHKTKRHGGGSTMVTVNNRDGRGDFDHHRRGNNRNVSNNNNRHHENKNQPANVIDRQKENNRLSKDRGAFSGHISGSTIKMSNGEKTMRPTNGMSTMRTNRVGVSNRNGSSNRSGSSNTSGRFGGQR